MTPQEAIPSEIEKPADAITLWVIYKNPTDKLPGYYLRPQFSTKKAPDNEKYGRIESEHVGPAQTAVVIISPLVWRAKTFEELEAILPPNCIPLGPDPLIPAIVAHYME